MIKLGPEVHFKAIQSRSLYFFLYFIYWQ